MNYVCPHCGTPQVVTEKAFGRSSQVLTPGKAWEMGEEGSSVRISSHAVRCANADCNRLSVTVELQAGYRDTSSHYRLIGDPIFSGRVYPPVSGKPFPSSVPNFLLEDYNEAWAVIQLSPKSSATLARRCLQSAIRDFCGIKKRTLFHEIEALEQKLESNELPKGVETETVAAMKALKDIGNYGAHMTEVDGRIVGVDPGEAEALLGLIETLFTDWYVARAKRAEGLARIEAIAADKANGTSTKEAGGAN